MNTQSLILHRYALSFLQSNIDDDNLENLQDDGFACESLEQLEQLIQSELTELDNQLSRVQAVEQHIGNMTAYRARWEIQDGEHSYYEEFDFLCPPDVNPDEAGCAIAMQAIEPMGRLDRGSRYIEFPNDYRQVKYRGCDRLVPSEVPATIGVVPDYYLNWYKLVTEGESAHFEPLEIPTPHFRVAVKTVGSDKEPAIIYVSNVVAEVAEAFGMDEEAVEEQVKEFAIDFERERLISVAIKLGERINPALTLKAECDLTKLYDSAGNEIIGAHE